MRGGHVVGVEWRVVLLNEGVLKVCVFRLFFGEDFVLLRLEEFLELFVLSELLLFELKV